MRVMGVDPGGKTGVAVVDLEPLEVVHFEQIPGGERDHGGLDAAHRVLFLALQYGVKQIICEDFILRNKPGGLNTSRVGLSPVRIGAYLYALWSVDAAMQFSQVGFSFQGTDILPVMSNDRLKALGVWAKGEHARDALRHAIVWGRKQ